MAVAFLFDLALLQNSNGRNSVSDIFRKLYASHRLEGPATDANAAMLKVFQTQPQLADIIEQYIKGPQKIEWQVQLAAAGIENEPGNTRTNLRVMPKLNGRQKALLDKLGYNNWRKLTRK
jgi:predicted metalloprotease with PDZ domain